MVRYSTIVMDSLVTVAMVTGLYFSSAAQDAIIKEGLIFFYPSGRLPLEGVFVEIKLDINRSLWDHMQQLDDQTDTGVIVPLFELGWSGKTYESSVGQAIPFKNEAEHSRQTDENILSQEYSDDFLAEVVPVRLQFMYDGSFSIPGDPAILCKTAIIRHNKKLLAFSRAKPENWGILADMEVVSLRVQ